MAKKTVGHVTITGSDPRGAEVQILYHLARHKGCAVDTTYQQGADLVSLHDRNLAIAGFWPSVEYLEDRFPYPPVLPDTPAKRAIIRSLAMQLFKSPETTGPRLFSHKTQQFLFSNDAPLLIDFIAAIILPDTDSLAQYKRVVLKESTVPFTPRRKYGSARVVWPT